MTQPAKTTFSLRICIQTAINVLETRGKKDGLARKGVGVGGRLCLRVCACPEGMCFLEDVGAGACALGTFGSFVLVPTRRGWGGGGVKLGERQSETVIETQTET